MANRLLPDPLRGEEYPSFTHYSVTVRLPEIARRLLSENDFQPETIARIEQLIREIPDGSIRKVDTPLAPDFEQWEEYIAPYTNQNWLQVPWFFAEEYFYLRVLEAIGYFHPGPGRGLDPYRLQKKWGLEATRGAIHHLTTYQAESTSAGSPFLQALSNLMLVDLWGNQNDLSLWPVDITGVDQPAPSDVQRTENITTTQHLLADDRHAVFQYLHGLDPESAQVDFLIDNAGYELVCDLVLADTLLSGRHVKRIVFHVKQQPVFVSDAMPVDVMATLEFMRQEGHSFTQALAIRMQKHLTDQVFKVETDPFWTSPLAMWDMPAHLQSKLARSNLVISKGDANYRRLLGDRHWPASMPFSDVLQYMPVPVLSFRTLKSEIVIGLPKERVPHQDPDWMSNGRWGLIQFANPT